MLLASSKPDEFQTIINEPIDEAFHEMHKAKASALRMPHLLFYRQRIISKGESEAFAKHTKYAKHAFFACRMPPIPAEAAPTPPCPLMTNYLVSRLSFFVRRPSSVVRRPSP